MLMIRFTLLAFSKIAISLLRIADPAPTITRLQRTALTDERKDERSFLSLSLLWERERERQEEERARQKETRLENRINAGAKATPFQRTRRDAFSLHSASGRQLTLVGHARNSFPLRFFPCLTCLRKSCAVRDRLVGPMRGNREETRGVRKGRGNKVSTNGAEEDERYSSINEAKYRSLALVAAARMQF